LPDWMDPAFAREAVARSSVLMIEILVAVPSGVVAWALLAAARYYKNRGSDPWDRKAVAAYKSPVLLARKPSTQGGTRKPAKKAYKQKVAPKDTTTTLPSTSAPVSSAPTVGTPDPMDDCEFLVTGVVGALSSLASPSTGQEQTTPFHCRCVLAMSIGDYIRCIRCDSGCDSTCYVLALIYIERLTKMHPEISFSALSWHRLIITAITLAAKFHEDTYYSNNYYAEVGGVSLRELNMLEQLFLKMIDWKLQVSPEEYETCANLALRAAPKVAASANE